MLRKGQRLINYLRSQGVKDEEMHRVIFYIDDTQFENIIKGKWLNMKTTKEIFTKCITLSKFAVDTGLDKDYKLRNTKSVWDKEKWFSVSDVEQLQKELFEIMSFKPCLLTNLKLEIESRKKCNCYYCKQEVAVIELFNNFKGK